MQFNRKIISPGGVEEDFRIRLAVAGLTPPDYGILEAQFARYFALAEKNGDYWKYCNPGDQVDNVVYRLQLASSRREARQMVRHGFFQVNGKKVNIPSYPVKAGDVIQLKEKALQSAHFKSILEANDGQNIPEWLELDTNTWTGRVKNIPSREQIDVPIQEHLIVELYSR